MSDMIKHFDGSSIILSANECNRIEKITEHSVKLARDISLYISHFQFNVICAVGSFLWTAFQYLWGSEWTAVVEENLDLLNEVVNHYYFVLFGRLNKTQISTE